MSCLEELPNEVILKTFVYLNKMDLGRCARVSKRFQAISQNEVLWQRVNPNIFCQVLKLGTLNNKKVTHITF